MWKYCGIIFKLWFLILCLFFHPYVSFFSFLFFSFLLHFVHHTCIPITSSPSFFFSLLPLDSRSYLPHSFFLFSLLPLDSKSSLTLSLALSFFFSFSTWFHKFSSSLCDMSHIILLAFWCHIFKHTQTRIERKEKSPLLHHTATVPPLLLLFTTECMQPGVISASIFFSLFLISCCFWL